MSRNQIIDSVKLIDSFFRITLHVGRRKIPIISTEFTRFSARLTVPFFFIATSYFLAKKSQLTFNNCIKIYS